jgi:WD40 repeat protein
LTRISDAAAYELAWLPGGEALWYSTATHPLDPRDPTSRDIRRLDLATGSDTRVFELGGGGWVGLAPVAGEAVFARFVTGSDYEIDLFDERTGQRRIGEGSNLRLSTDGTLLAYVTPSCQGTPTLRIVDLAHADGPIAIPSLAAINIAWLPDDRLAVRIRREPAAFSWVIVNPATSAVTPLSDVIGADTSGSFSLSPDGKHVVLYEAEPARRLILKDIAAGTETTLDIPGGEGTGDWSPDSSRFVLLGEQALTIVSSNGATIDTIPSPVGKGPGYYVWSPKWSPDGKSLLFSVAESHPVGVCD